MAKSIPKRCETAEASILIPTTISTSAAGEKTSSIAKVCTSTQTDRSMMGRFKRALWKAKEFITTTGTLIMRGLGTKGKSMGKDCITVKRRFMKANVNTVSVQEMLIMIISCLKKLTLVVFYVESGMGEERLLTLMEVSIKESLWTIYRMEKVALSMQTKIDM